jgi:hypothetical protein
LDFYWIVVNERDCYVEEHNDGERWACVAVLGAWLEAAMSRSTWI